MSFWLLILKEILFFACEWLHEWCDRDPRFLCNLLIGDEAAFAMNGEVNTYNAVKYAPAQQPPVLNFDQKMSRKKVTIWVGLCGSGVLNGPFFFERNVTGQAYLQMIDENVVPQMEVHFDLQEMGSSVICIVLKMGHQPTVSLLFEIICICICKF